MRLDRTHRDAVGPLTSMICVLALVAASPCSRVRVVGHYFAPVTLAVGEVVRLLIVRFIVFLPSGIYGTLRDVAPPVAARPTPAT